MFDPLSSLHFRKPRLRNWSVLVAALVWLLSVAGSFTGPADAAIITTGDVDPGGAAAQPDPWVVGMSFYVGKYGDGTLNVYRQRSFVKRFGKECFTPRPGRRFMISLSLTNTFRFIARRFIR